MISVVVESNLETASSVNLFIVIIHSNHEAVFAEYVLYINRLIFGYGIINKIPSRHNLAFLKSI